jgi:hypothetical protein
MIRGEAVRRRVSDTLATVYRIHLPHPYWRQDARIRREQADLIARVGRTRPSTVGASASRNARGNPRHLT